MKERSIYNVMLPSTLAIAVATGVLFFAGVVSAQDKGWKVWVKTSPCSRKIDWVSVAKTNPGLGGGGSMWSNADLILTGTGMHCVRNIDESCTFAEATAEADVVSTSTRFSDFCCREYSVWENAQSGKMSVVVGKFGTAGFGWRQVKGDLCCDEAEELAGIPGACSDSQGGGTGKGRDLTGSWSIVQTAPNGAKTTGTLKLKLVGNVLSGRADWDGHNAGTVSGEVRGSTVKFDINYGNGLIGTYEGVLSSGGQQLVDGSARSNKGGPAVSWHASRN